MGTFILFHVYFKGLVFSLKGPGMFVWQSSQIPEHKKGLTLVKKWKSKMFYSWILNYSYIRQNSGRIILSRCYAEYARGGACRDNGVSRSSSMSRRLFQYQTSCTFPCDKAVGIKHNTIVYIYIYMSIALFCNDSICMQTNLSISLWNKQLFIMRSPFKQSLRCSKPESSNQWCISINKSTKHCFKKTELINW